MAAYAEPFQPNVTAADAPAKKHDRQRVSVINQVLKNTTASIEQSTIVSSGTSASRRSMPPTSPPMRSRSRSRTSRRRPDRSAQRQEDHGAACSSPTWSTARPRPRYRRARSPPAMPADVKVSATDDTFIDATIFVNIDSRGKLGKLYARAAPSRRPAWKR